MASIEIVTKDDLQVFKKELLAELQQMIIIPNSQMKQWLKSGEVRDILKISAGTLQTFCNRLSQSPPPAKAPCFLRRSFWVEFKQADRVYRFFQNRALDQNVRYNNLNISATSFKAISAGNAPSM